MADIPNTSSSPYYLQRIGGHTGRADGGGESLRSIPAWDPSYLGSSLLAKRIRKTLAAVEDRLNAIATGGVDYALLEQMVNNTLAGMNLEGLNEAQVNALIAAAIASLPDSGLTEDQVNALIAAAIASLPDSGLTEDQVNALIAAAIASLPDSGLTEAQVNALIATAVSALPDSGLSEAAVQALIDTAVAGIAVTSGDIQPLLDVLGIKPNATLADVTTVWQAMSDANTALYLLINTLSGKPGGGGTVADVLPALQVAMTSIVEMALGKPLSGPLVVSSSVTAGVAGDTAEIVAFHPDNKPVNLDLQAPGGVVRANGQPILNEVEIRAAATDLLTKSPTITSPRVTDARVGVFWSAGGEARVAQFEHADAATWLRISNGASGPELGTVTATGSVLDADIRVRPRGRGALVVGTAGATATVRANGDLNDVDLRLEAQGTGKVKVGESRVLTEADLAALGTGSGAVDAAVVEAAVNAAVAAATAPLIKRIDDLESGLANAGATLAGVFNQLNEMIAQVSTETYEQIEALKNDKASLADLGVAEQGLVDLVESYVEGLNAAIELKADNAAVQANTTNIQQIFDVFAQQEGGSIRQLQTFYDNLTKFLMDTMTAFSKFGQGSSSTESVEGFLAAVNDAVSNLFEKTVELTQMDAEIVQYVAEQIAGATAPDLSAYAKKTDLAPYAKTADENQVLTAKSITVGGVRFTDTGEILAPFEDEYGKRLRLIPANLSIGEEVPIVVVHTDLQDILAPRTSNDLELVDLVTRDMLNSGRGVPEQGWSDCQIVNGSAGTVPVQARVVNGVVQLQGDLKYTYTSSGTYVDVVVLPDGIPTPTHDIHFPIYGIESGVSYRIGLCRVQANGRVQITATTGKVTAVSFGNITYPVG